MDYTAVILAGGAAKRLGGVAKPALPVAGVPMIVRVLRAVDRAAARVVVGPPGLPVPPQGVRLVREHPPGGGPVAAVAAAFHDAPPATGLVAIVGGDLPLLTAESIDRLCQAASSADGAVFTDRDGRAQWLCGVWRVAAVQAKLGQMEHRDAALKRLFGDLDFARVPSDATMPPWFDCDTADDIRRVEEWLTR